MPDTTVRVEYIGAVQNFSEVTLTGNQQVWRIGTSAHVEPSRAAQLVASGKFRSLANDPAMLPANQAKVGAIPSDEGVDFVVGQTVYPFITQKSSLGQMLDGFGALTGHSIGPGGAMTLVDSVPVEMQKSGKSMQVTVPAGTTKNFDITLSDANNVCPNKHLKLIVENLSDDLTGTATWYIANDAGLANHFYTSVAFNKRGIFAIDAANSSAVNRWTVGAGTPSFDGIAKVRLTLSAPAASDLSLIFHGLYSAPAKRTHVRLIQDDGMISGYTEFLPLLNKYGFKAGFSIIKSLLGGGGYMTLDMLAQLYSEGHDVIPHGEFAMSSFVSSDAAIADIQTNAKFLLEKGYTRGSTVYVYPQGVWYLSSSDRMSIIDYLKSAGFSHAFIASGSTDSNTRGFGKYTIARYPANAAVNTATLLATLDMAIESGQDMTIMFHAIVASGAAGDAALRSDVAAILDGINTRVLAGKCDVVSPSHNLF